MSILEVIESVEKVPAQAKRRVSTYPQQPKLKDLFKALCYDTSVMAQNMKNIIYNKDDAMRAALLERYELTDGKKPSSDQIDEYTQDLVTGMNNALPEQEYNLTGEWIIMDMVDGRYRYLCLAMHELSREQPDLLLMEADKGRESMFEFKKMLSWSMK
ncbi:hypothetical protein [Methylophaga nitratireducenticrescens]|uniref:hypothetical protein n=1 Tax=Methylophaga nitratireducenticrescens TaxID=754476 RepID=UPI000CDBA85E|nr:hypothetical protein [Methylophaga nitratireducenticrescens]AUZ84760.1 hypothetical protein CDW43_09305 [Methylophaga nitratireducenticrescens]